MLSWISVIANISVAAGTLILACMAYKQIKEGRRAKALEIHTSDLKNLAKLWRDQLPDTPAGYVPVLSPPAPETYQIEEHPLFPDIANHTPPEWDILKTWEEFKKQLYGYAKKKYELFEDIHEMSIERAGLDYDPDLSKNNAISKYFPMTIYEQLVTWAKNKEEKKYSSLGYDIKENEEGYIVSPEGLPAHPLFKVNNKEFMERTKRIHEEMMNDLEHFREKIEEILKIAENLEKYQNKLKNMLNDFISIPILQGTCKFIKWSVSYPFEISKASQLIKDKSKINLYKLSTIFYLCAIATFVIWIYIQFFSLGITTFSLALLGIILAFVLMSIGTLLLKIRGIHGE